MSKLVIRIVLVVANIILISNMVVAQETCILGVGISKDQTLIDVFQLNDVQSELLVNLSAELKFRNEHLDNQVDQLLKRHAQSTPGELTALAQKYTVIMDSIQKVQLMIDKRVLKTFNKKQYERYLELCDEAYRNPIRVIPETLRDSLPKER